MNFYDSMAEPGFTATSSLSFRFTDLRRASTSKTMAGVPRKRKTGRASVKSSLPVSCLDNPHAPGPSVFTASDLSRFFFLNFV